jgi:hypothetical protein
MSLYAQYSRYRSGDLAGTMSAGNKDWDPTRGKQSSGLKQQLMGGRAEYTLLVRYRSDVVTRRLLRRSVNRWCKVLPVGSDAAYIPRKNSVDMNAAWVKMPI